MKANMSHDLELIKKIVGVGKKLEKHSKLGNDKKVLEYLRMLENIAVTVEVLQQTGIGRIVQALRKNNKSYSNAAKTIVVKWKKLVTESSQNSQNGTLKRKLSLEDYKQKKFLKEGGEVLNNFVNHRDADTTLSRLPHSGTSDVPNPCRKNSKIPDLPVSDLKSLSVNPVRELPLSQTGATKKATFPPPPNPVRDMAPLDLHFHSRKSKSVMYHGKRYGSTSIPSLFDMSVQVLKENIDDLTYVGCIPFHILKPVFEVANATQLEALHYHNPQFADEIEVLWERICKLEFKGMRPDNMESWYDFYMRRKSEDEERLNALRVRLSSKFSSLPKVRTTKLTNFSELKPSNEKNKKLSHTRIIPVPCGSSPQRPQVSFNKPKVAPLMAKTLKMLKQRRY